eukprot:gnl/Chilomastix_caulleri/7294.p6 GENE.gnl/Chilomastix_caulleri/7294~~gnl/Chilomastix_caulleri/7294.p6  ORF type:complete len:51 (+),score=17.82 gnl/Chilomastix_caulleri/7294:534-686(+)
MTGIGVGVKAIFQEGGGDGYTFIINDDNTNNTNTQGETRRENVLGTSFHH